jgi:hypothetical protein
MISHLFWGTPIYGNPQLASEFVRDHNQSAKEWDPGDAAQHCDSFPSRRWFFGTWRSHSLDLPCFQGPYVSKLGSRLLFKETRATVYPHCVLKHWALKLSFSFWQFSCRSQSTWIASIIFNMFTPATFQASPCMETKEWPLQTALKVRDVVAERAWDLRTISH